LELRGAKGWEGQERKEFFPEFGGFKRPFPLTREFGTEGIFGQKLPQLRPLSFGVPQRARNLWVKEFKL